MKFNVEKLKTIARPMKEIERQEFESREENRNWLALSAKFALCVRRILRFEGITQRELAKRMDVSASQITKILSGKENICLQTITNVEKVLGRRIIDFYEYNENQECLHSPQMPKNYMISDRVADYACDGEEGTYPSHIHEK